MTKKLSEFTTGERITDATGNSRIYVSKSGSDKYVEHADLVSRDYHTGIQPLSTISDAGTLAGLDEAALANIEAMPVSTIVGNSSTSVSAAPTALTAAQARTLLNVENGATANASNADLRDRSTHTGTQPLSSIEGLTDALAAPIVDELTANAIKLDIDGTIYDVDIGNADSGETGYRVLQILNTTGTPSYGSFSITSGNIDVDENTSGIVVSVARSGGTSGANTVTWTVTAGLTTVATNTLSWGDTETGTKTFTLTAANIAGPSDASGTVSIAVTSGSATTGTNSVTMDVRYVAPETPGVMSISSTFPIGESGTNFTVLIDRLTGSDGAVAVDWTCTSGSHTTPLSGTETWIDGNSARKTVTLTRSTVSSNTYGTITLSNARRTDGGTTQPTISASATSTSFGITPSTSAGTISLVSTAIDEDENTPLPIVLTRAGGSAGAVTARWTITGDTGVDTDTGLITWAAGEFGDKSPDTLPVGDFVATNKTGGILTVTIVSGSATLLAPVTGTIAVRDVPTSDGYTIANAVAGLPSSPFVSPTAPTSPTIASTVSANTGTIGSYITGNQQKRVELTAGTYGDVTITGTNIELVLTTGVIISKLRITSAARYIRITADPVRSGVMETLWIGDRDTNLPAKDITIDGITQLTTNENYDNAYNDWLGQRLAIINSSITGKFATFIGYSGAAPNDVYDVIIGNNKMTQTGLTAANSGFGARVQGWKRFVFVDNLLDKDADSPSSSIRQNLRIHSRPGLAATDGADSVYVGRNLICGIGNAFQRTGDGGASAEMTNIYYVGNTQYAWDGTTSGQGYGQPLNPGPAATHYPTTLTMTGNTIIAPQNLPSTPSGYTWVNSGNTWTNTASATVGAAIPAVVAAWDFDTWRA